MNIDDDRINLLKEIEDIESGMAIIDGVRISVLSEIIFVYKTTLAYFSSQEERLSRKLGEDHPRVKDLETHLKKGYKTIGDIEIESELAKIDVPSIPENGALVHGRISDSSNRGIPGLSVTGEDEKGLQIRDFGSSKTNTPGYYSIIIHPKIISISNKGQYFLSVRSHFGELIHREENPLKVRENCHLIVNMIIT